MAFKTFVIPVRQHESAEAELNDFPRSHKVLAIERRWVDRGADSFWAIQVDHLHSVSSSALATKGSSSKPKVAYKEVLSAEDFDLFSQLRMFRKELAATDGIPVYAVFTNEQLAKMVE